MAMTQTLFSTGGISLGSLESIMDFFSDPDSYEPDLSEVKTISDKKPIEIVKKPVVKPKLTREGLINKYSLVSNTQEVKNDSIITDDLVVNETDDFDFGDMEFDIEDIEKEEAPKLEDNTELQTKLEQQLIAEQAAELIRMQDIEKEKGMEVDDIEVDVDIDDFEDEDSDDNIEIDIDDFEDEEDDEEESSEIEFDIDIDDEDDKDDKSVQKQVQPAQKQVQQSTKQKSYEDEFDIELDDFEIDDIDIDDEDDKPVQKTSSKEEFNGIEFDIDIDDEDEDSDTEEISVQSIKPPVKHKETESIQDKINNKASEKAINDKKENKNNLEIDFDIDIDDDDEDTDIDIDIDIDIDDLDESVKEEVKKPNQVKQEKVEQKATQTDINMQLLEELNRLREENSKLRQNQVNNSKNNDNTRQQQAKSQVKSQAKPQNKASQSFIDTFDVDKIKAKQNQEVEGSEYDKYTVMNINALYKTVHQYMIEKGVRQKPIDIKDLNDKFGPLNIKKLIVKQYLIKTKKGVTVGL